MPQVGVGPQQLDDVGAAAAGGGGGACSGSGSGLSVEPAQPVGEPAQRAAAERGRVLPALPEDGLDVVDGRALDRDLDVVPRRVRRRTPR